MALRAGRRLAGLDHRTVDLECVATGATAVLVPGHANRVRRELTSAARWVILDSMVEDGAGTPTSRRLRPAVPAQIRAADAEPTGRTGSAAPDEGVSSRGSTPADDGPERGCSTPADDGPAAGGALSDKTGPLDGPALPDEPALSDKPALSGDTVEAGEPPSADKTDEPDRTTTLDKPAKSELTVPPAEGTPPAPAQPSSTTVADPRPPTGPPPARKDAPFATRVGWLHPARLRPAARGARRVGRSARAWCRRPTGRLVIPGLLLLALIAGTGTAGAVIVPAVAGTPVPAATPTTMATTAVPELPQGTDPDLYDPDFPQFDDEEDPLTQGDPVRPASVLTPWATQTSSRVSIPVIALEAYGYAELVLANTTPRCKLSWTTLAAIGMIESTHGTANGSRLDTNGRAVPPIVGLPLDGNGGRQRIADTDGGRLDNDLVYDRAVGPMQFIPTTWAEFAVDADNDGAADPQDIDDASLAAANYLCRNGRDLSNPSDWWSAILSYNNVQPYAQAVFDTANEYGVRSRT
jgi:membrane-bound lytic murein transglycosylase B